MQWSQKVCERLPDCPHFHVVFTVPKEFHDFFEGNYRLAADIFTAASAETLKTFQRNNWNIDGGFLSVLHTWGSRLNWHPHLHVLVSAGGIDRGNGRWKSARPDYLFPVKAMSKVFRAVMLRRIEALDQRTGIEWPEAIRSVEQRRDWRLTLAARSWNIFSKPTLGNTRAVVRYLARYTSRIAMSNARIEVVDEERRTVSFRWKDYRNGGRNLTREMGGKQFVRRFTRHLVPKGFRRIRYFGILSGATGRIRKIAGAPASAIHENAPIKEGPECDRCKCTEWKYTGFFVALADRGIEARPIALTPDVTPCQSTVGRFSLVLSRSGP